MKVSKQFQQTFLGSQQMNPSNSGKGKDGNYKRTYNKTKASLVGKPEEFSKFPCDRGE